MLPRSNSTNSARRKALVTEFLGTSLDDQASLQESQNRVSRRRLEVSASRRCLASLKVALVKLIEVALDHWEALFEAAVAGANQRADEARQDLENSLGAESVAPQVAP